MQTTTTSSTKTDLIGSVQRALRILELLAKHPAGLNAKQIHQKLRLNLSTCYHLLNTLLVADYVVKDPDSLQFRLSGKIGYTVHNQATPAQMIRQLEPHVHALQEATHETAYLSIRDEQDIYLSAIVESPRSVRVKALTIGSSKANHASALGKAILAYYSKSELHNYLAEHPLTTYTPNTLTNPSQLISHLAQVCLQQYSLDLEEYLPEVCCIGAPIFDAQGQIFASIAISLPTARYQTHSHCLLPMVQQSAQAASRTLQIIGYAQPSSVT